MSAMASQITGVSIVYSTVCSGADQWKHQSSASLAFVRGFHRWPVNSPHTRPVTWKMFPFYDVIIWGTIDRIIVRQLCIAFEDVALCTSFSGSCRGCVVQMKLLTKSNRGTLCTSYTQHCTSSFSSTRLQILDAVFVSGVFTRRISYEWKQCVSFKERRKSAVTQGNLILFI